MVVRAPTAQKRSVALGAVFLTLTAPLAFGTWNLLSPQPSPLWLWTVVSLLSLAGLAWWFVQGLVLAVRIGPEGVQITRLLGSDEVGFAMVQSLRVVKSLGQTDYALMLNNGTLVPLSLGLFPDKAALVAALREHLEAYNAHAGFKIDLPS